MSNLTQKNRIAELTTPLGEDKVVVRRLEAYEAISENFEYTIEALSEDEDVDFDPAIGRNCVVKVNSFNGLVRHFNGVLVQAQWTGLYEDLFTYRMVLRPWFWLLSHTTDCRFFQEMTAPDIIKQVLTEASFTDFEMKLSQSYPKMEYCVQYRESTYAFVSRLLEEHGIYYYFEHSEDKHVMVMADSMSAHQPIAGGGNMPFIPVAGAYVRAEEHLQQWNTERKFRTGRVMLNDYDFKKPNAKMDVNKEGAEGYEKSKLEVYDYPGRYVNTGDGDQFAKAKLDAEQAVDRRRYASGEAVCIYPGGKLTLSGHPRGAENREYLALSATHSVTVESYRTTGGGGERDMFTGSYGLMPANRTFRPPTVTPKPIVPGVQTAKVVGEAGEEITCDKYGRVKVQFHWDRKKKQSCWIRVASVWAGKSWGGIYIPRIGDEVVVDFLEGDPDRPLIVGSVWNADNMPVYTLPDNKTMMGVKSNTSKGGGGFNEFVMEDKKSSQLIRMHAEKDHEVKVRHKETVNIGETFETPKGSPSREVTIVLGDDKLTIGSGDRDVTIAQEDKLTMGSNQTITIGGNQTATIAGNQTETTAGNQTVTLGGSQTVTAAQSVTITAGMSMTLVAPMSLTLVCGGTVVSLSPGGLVINAPMMAVNAAGTVINSSTVINGKSPVPPLVCGKLVVG